MRTHEHMEGNTTQWGLLGGIGEGQRRGGGTAAVGSWGGIAWEETPDVGEGEEDSKSHCHMCTYATILHVLQMYPQNLKCN